MSFMKKKVKNINIMIKQNNFICYGTTIKENKIIDIR